MTAHFGFEYLSPAKVESSYSTLFSPQKRGARSMPTFGRNGSTWKELIQVNLDLISRHLDFIAERKAAGTPLKPAELIEVRCAIDLAIRRASTRPAQYAAPLYFSDAVARCALANTNVPKVIEHAVPLTVMVSGTKLIADPEGYFARLPYAFLVPVCVITKAEDPANRIGHPELEANSGAPNPITLPFLRYKEAGIRLYRASDFNSVDPDLFTWGDHIEQMRKFPAYATGLDSLADIS